MSTLKLPVVDHSDQGRGLPTEDTPSRRSSTSSTVALLSLSADGSLSVVCDSPLCHTATTPSPEESDGQGGRGGHKAVSRVTSLEPDDALCPPAWMTPTDITMDCIWQPMKPGYTLPVSDNSLTGKNRKMGSGVEGGKCGKTVHVISRTVDVGRFSVRRDSHDNDGALKQSVPIMWKPLAITCLIFNVLSPGLGTFASGLSVFCPSWSRRRTARVSTVQVLWMNTWVALLQLLTTPLFLIGWVWSVFWGIAFVQISNAFEDIDCDDDLPRSSPTTNDPDHATAGMSTTSPSSTTCTTTTTATLSEQSSSSRTSIAEPPIIILHEAPIIFRPETTDAEYLWRRTQSCTSAREAAIAAGRRQNRIVSGGGRRGSSVRRISAAHDPGWGRSTAGGDRRSFQYPGVLLTPGALETLVMNNGAFVTSNRSTPSGRRNAGSGCDLRRGRGGDESATGGTSSGSTDSSFACLEKTESRRTMQTTQHR